MTQADTVLDWLRERGSRGLHTFELRAHYVGNPSQRIAELEARGYTITRTREKLNGKATGTRYVLTVDAETSGAASASNAPAGVSSLPENDAAPDTPLFDAEHVSASPYQMDDVA